MNPILFGELNCKRVPYNKALRRHVERRVSEWVLAHGFEEYPKGLTYQVTLEREGGGHTISCEAVISTKEAQWSGHSWARSPEEAVAQALSRMRQLAGPPYLGRAPQGRKVFEPQIA